MRQTNPKHTWRLNMKAALDQLTEPLFWHEFDPENPKVLTKIPARPELWGDVVLARSDTPTSYHLAVTVDDAIQNITHVVRGLDLYEATAVHRLLQKLLDLPAPLYHHHDLVIDNHGRKLSKSDGDVSLSALREKGVSARQLPDYFRFETD
jgi:glutamyl-Q tRNA(Asp) synthetase